MKNKIMTLKEKFKQWLDTEPRVQIREVPLEVIADEFAIRFADWCLKIRFEPIENISVEKLLEIYKKEKEL